MHNEITRLNCEYFGNSKINRKNIKEKMIIDRWNNAKLSELRDRVTHE